MSTVKISQLPLHIRNAYLDNPNICIEQPQLWNALMQSAGYEVGTVIVADTEDAAPPVPTPPVQREQVEVTDDRVLSAFASLEEPKMVEQQISEPTAVALVPEEVVDTQTVADNVVEPTPAAAIELALKVDQQQGASEVKKPLETQGENGALTFTDAFNTIPRPNWSFHRRGAPTPTGKSVGQGLAMPSLSYPVSTGMYQLINRVAESGRPIDEVSIRQGREALMEDELHPHPQHTFGSMFDKDYPATRWVDGLSDGETSQLIKAATRTPDARSAVTPASATALFASRRGRGRHVSIPLVHSGFWIILQPMRDPDIYEFYRAITEETAAIGDKTFGMGLRASEYRLNEIILDLALDNIERTTTTLSSKEEIRRHIHIFDIPSIIAHMAAAIYPNGFDYTRRCTVDPTKCTALITDMLNPIDLVVYNETKTTREMARFMTAGRVSQGTTPEDLAAYRKMVEAVRTNDRIDLGDGIVLHLQEPTLEMYFTTARDWMLHVRERVLQAVTDPEDRAGRLKRTLEILRIEESYNYISWIRAVEFTIDGEESNIITDREIIDSVIRENVGDIEVSIKLLEGTDIYRSYNMLSMVGLDPHACPHCGGVHRPTKGATTENTEYHDFIHLDPGAVFFTLAYQRQQVSQSLEV